MLFKIYKNKNKNTHLTIKNFIQFFVIKNRKYVIFQKHHLVIFFCYFHLSLNGYFIKQLYKHMEWLKMKYWI